MDKNSSTIFFKLHSNLFKIVKEKPFHLTCLKMVILKVIQLSINWFTMATQMNKEMFISKDIHKSYNDIFFVEKKEENRYFVLLIHKITN